MSDNGNQPVVGSVVFSPQVNLLIERYFPLAFAEISKLMEHGATTHPHDLEWRDHPIRVHLQRALAHITEFEYGKEVDPDSGQCHLINAATRLIMAAEMYQRGR